MRFVLPYIKQHKRQYIPAILFLLISTGLDMLNPLLTRSIIDNVIGQGQTQLLFSVLLALLLVSLGRAVSGYEREYLFDRAASGLAADMRRDIFRHLNTLSVSFFDSRNTGELMSRIKEDVENVMSSTGFCVMLLIQQGFYIVIPTAMLFTLNWKLTLLYLLFLPLVMYLAYVLEKKLGAVFEKISDQAAVLNTTAQENITGVRLVRSMAREDHEEEKFDRENDHNYRLNREQARIWADLNPVIMFLASLMTILVITVGGIFVIGGDMSVGTLVAVNGYGVMLAWPMQELGWLINLMAQARASIKK
ncbi:MAG: ABC transporter ATP-binding protein, partial [Firmicutes bacterium]|nr:ABC transporter ATP-binding protein [Bacillota bacterium]